MIKDAEPETCWPLAKPLQLAPSPGRDPVLRVPNIPVDPGPKNTSALDLRERVDQPYARVAETVFVPANHREIMHECRGRL
jgi:hypothetical protein